MPELICGHVQTSRVFVAEYTMPKLICDNVQVSTNQTNLSNPGRFLKNWICFLPGIVNAGWKLSTITRFQKKWILKALFPRRSSLSDIQLLKKDGFLDMRSEKFFSTV